MLKTIRAILPLVLLLGCNSGEVLPKRTGQEFLGFRDGAYWEYAVTETTISQVNGQINELYDIRVEVISSESNELGVSYILRRRYRPTGTTDWSSSETWSARIETFQLIEQEGNIPFVKLKFPLTEGKLWNGNALNNLGGPDACEDGKFKCENYVATNLAKAFEIPGSSSYDDTVTIIENNDDDPIVMKDVRKSIYAVGIGLVYREETHLEYCTVGSCIGQQEVENGRIVKETLTAYGDQ